MRSSGAKLTLVSLLVILTAVGMAWVLEIGRASCRERV